MLFAARPCAAAAAVRCLSKSSFLKSAALIYLSSSSASLVTATTAASSSSSSLSSTSAALIVPHFTRMSSTSTNTDNQNNQFCYRYPRPSVTVDTLIFAAEDAQVKLLLIKRGNPPFEGKWALPGGFVDKDESLDAAAARELKEETSLSDLAFAQCGSFGDPGRDPRGHTVTVAYAAFLGGKSATSGVKAGDDAKEAKFFPFGKLPELAFDHKKIIEETWSRLMVVPAQEGEGYAVMERGSGKILADLSKEEPGLAEVVGTAMPF